MLLTVYILTSSCCRLQYQDTTPSHLNLRAVSRIFTVLDEKCLKKPIHHPRNSSVGVVSLLGGIYKNLAGGVCNKRPFSKIESFVNFATTSRPPITLLLVGIFGLCLLSKLFSALRVNFGAFQSNVGGNIITWWMVAINFFDGGWLLMTTHIFRTSDDELRKI